MAPLREDEASCRGEDRGTDPGPDRQLLDPPCADVDLRDVSTERSVRNGQKALVVERPRCSAATDRLARKHCSRFPARCRYQLQIGWRAGRRTMKRDPLAVVRPRSPPIARARGRRCEACFLARAIRRRAPPVGGTQYTFMPVPSSDRKAILEPSGDQRGMASSLGPPATSRGSPPPSDMTATSIDPFKV